ncbi:transglutaminase-like domain-containing protein [uncultured Gimesia sp.]|uniref:SirB1 family protein n=1 Tax=uncultured Gimesia sp. TaxID=1678688 RepID=UPI0030D734B5|tara:strand:+ start:189708 stop:190553 length:846 start_codon:yes stop_codon:yes gene_type:complete
MDISHILQFKQDQEFSKLLHHDNYIDLTIAALELARDDQPDLQFEPILIWIRSRACELSGRVALSNDDRSLVQCLADCLAKQHGLMGNTTCYHQPEGSYLNRVVESKQGLPISLSLIYMAVGKELGIDIQGVAAPIQFLVRYESHTGPLFIDPYAKGAIYNEQECIERLAELGDFPHSQLVRLLKPASHREIIVRMLMNLKRIHEEQQDYQRAWNVQCRLLALSPLSNSHKKDLAALSFETKKLGLAVELLESCLKSCPVSEQDDIKLMLQKAHAELANWN